MEISPLSTPGVDSFMSTPGVGMKGSIANLTLTIYN